MHLDPSRKSGGNAFGEGLYTPGQNGRSRKIWDTPASGHKIVRNHKIVRLRILTSSLLANRRFVLNARGARSTEDQ